MAKRGLTGLETAIILVAFVITSSALAFIVLNMGFLSAERAQSVVAGSMSEASSALALDSGLIGSFTNLTGPQSAVCLTKLTLYVRLAGGGEPIDMGEGELVVTYTNPRCHASVYESNGTVTTVKGVTGDGDSMLEEGEKFKVVIDLTQLDKSGVDPAQSSMSDVYAHPYEEIRLELQPSSGSVLVVERVIPTVKDATTGF